jgi:hypothetical protein
MTKTPGTESTIVAEWPDRVVKALKGSVILGYGLAVAGFFVAYGGSDLSFWKAFLHGFVVLVLLAVPPTTAILSHPRRPLMLLPAAMMGVAGFLGVLSVLGYLLGILGLIWLWGYLKLAPEGKWVNKVAIGLVPLLWLAASTALWVHLDPACEQRLRNGTVLEVDPATRGFESGWTWEVSSTFSGSSGPTYSDVVFEACTSNALVAWEVLAAVALSAAAVIAAFALARSSSPEVTPIS